MLVTRQLSTRHAPGDDAVPHLDRRKPADLPAADVAGRRIAASPRSTRSCRRGSHWLWLFGVGFWAAVSHMCMTYALKFAPSATLAPLHYLEIVAAVTLGYLVFGDFPNAMTWAGIAVIVVFGSLHHPPRAPCRPRASRGGRHCGTSALSAASSRGAAGSPACRGASKRSRTSARCTSFDVPIRPSRREPEPLDRPAQPRRFALSPAPSETATAGRPAPSAASISRRAQQTPHPRRSGSRCRAVRRAAPACGTPPARGRPAPPKTPAPARTAPRSTAAPCRNRSSPVRRSDAGARQGSRPRRAGDSESKSPITASGISPAASARSRPAIRRHQNRGPAQRHRQDTRRRQARHRPGSHHRLNWTIRAFHADTVPN